MPRYDRMYAILARRAVREGGIDVESFVEQALETGMSPDNIQEQLMIDLENNGPLFGRFFRTLSGAAESAVLSAERQGYNVGVLNEIDPDESISRFRKIANMTDALADADPELLGEIEDSGAQFVEYTWVAELRNTCHLCLPLHGQSRFMDEWNELGFSPDTIHTREGWVSPCYCQLIPRKVASDRKELKQPLVRNKVKSVTGMKGSKRTARGVTQQDMDKAISSRDKAMESLQGRRTLRLLGKSVDDTTMAPGPAGSRKLAE